MNKIAVIILCIVTLLTAAVGTTLAYLTDSESSGEMVFVSGSVRVELEVETYGNLIPSKPIPYTVNVNNTGTSDAYVRLSIWVPKTLAQDISVKDNNTSDDWSQFGTPDTNDTDNNGFVEYTYLYKSPVAAHTSVQAVFLENIVVNGAATLAGVGTNNDIRFCVDAIQASMFENYNTEQDPFGNVKAAFDAFEDQKEREESSTNP
ncbi:MAG: hypothetical protein E7672_02565 [Ruminococcaceae bacterium]|nr:hypothetical protein [Oscillospiraceae bacterium]